MGNRNINTAVVVVLMSALAMTGCSSKKKGDSSIVPIPAPALRITEANAVEVASAAMYSWETLSGFEFAAALFIIHSTNTVSAMADVENEPSKILNMQSMYPLTAVSKARDTLFQRASYSDTISCTINGSLIISFTTASTTKPIQTPGDIFSISADSCDDGSGIVSTGNLSITIQSFEGDIMMPPYSAVYTAKLTDFTLTMQTSSGTYRGESTVKTSTSDGNLVLTEMSGAYANYFDSFGYSSSLFDYTVSRTDDISTSAYTLDYMGTVQNTALDASVQYATTKTLAGVGVENPSTGEIQVSGNQSGEVIMVVDTIDLIIELDGDGDNIADQTIPTTWDLLCPCL